MFLDPPTVESTHRASFYREAHIVLILFDLSQPETFKSITEWFRKIIEFSDQLQLIKIYLIGTKADLEGKVSDNEVFELITEWQEKLASDIEFIKTSARDTWFKSPQASDSIHPESILKQLAIDIGRGMSIAPEEEGESIIAKIILLGELGTGKTSLKEAFVGKGFTTNYLPTIGLDFGTKSVILTSEDLAAEPISQEAKMILKKKGPDKRTIYTGISYFDRMIPYKNFDLTVELSHFAIQEEKGKSYLVTGTRKTQKLEQLEFAIDVIQVVPLCPGCLVSPPSRVAQLTKPNQKLSFIITPLITGKIDGKIEFRTLEHEVLSQINIPSISRPSRIARIIAIVGVLIGVTPTGLEYLTGININTTLRNRLSQDIPALTTIFQGLNWLLLGELLLMISTLAFAGFLTYRLRPRKAKSFSEMDYSAVGA